MKKRFFLLALTVIVMVAYIVLSGFDETRIKPIDNGQFESYAATRFVAEKVPKERKVSVMGKNISLKYDSTVNDVDKLPQDRVDQYGTYDEYVDEEGNIYSFLHKSDLLCGIFYPNRTKEYVEPLSEDELREKAESYLKDVLGNDVFSIYTYDSMSNGGFYYFRYYYQLGEMKTDDFVIITVDVNGDIKSLSVWNLKKYTGISIDKYDIEKTEGTAMKYFSQLKYSDLKINEKYISMDYTGELQLTYGYTFTDENASRAERCHVTLVKK